MAGARPTGWVEELVLVAGCATGGGVVSRPSVFAGSTADSCPRSPSPNSTRPTARTTCSSTHWRFLIFNQFVEATRSIDLSISFPTGSAWGSPRLPDNVNDSAPAAWELTPSVSPDGRPFFYTRDGVIRRVELAAPIDQDEVPGLGCRKRA